MSPRKVIAISPSTFMEREAESINDLFKAGLYRYHIHKSNATEQAVAEILEGVDTKFLGQITLHSHYHLVLAYGVGGIHFSATHREALGNEYADKVGLYQGFGVKISTVCDEENEPTSDYIITNVPEYVGSDPSKFLLIKGNESSQIHGTNVALQLGENFKNDLERLSSLMSI